MSQPVNDTRSFPLREKALDAAGHKDYPLIAGVVSQQFEEAIEQVNAAKSAGVVSGASICRGCFLPHSGQLGE